MHAIGTCGLCGKLFETRALRDCKPPPRQIISICENWDYFYLDSHPDVSQNLKGSEFDKDQSSDFFFMKF